MDSLAFSNPVFHAGLNITVRLGDKWTKKVKPMDKVLLTNLNGTGLTEATVVGVLQTTFEYIPEELLKLEHDPLCRKVDGLFAVMNTVYPECKRTDTVTVLIFTLVD